MDAYYKIQLQRCEHPESLWTRLMTASEKLSKINITFDEGTRNRWYIKAIKESPEGRHYYTPLRAHHLAERQGKHPIMDDLRIALTFKYEEIQHNERPGGTPRATARVKPAAATLRTEYMGRTSRKNDRRHNDNPKKKAVHQHHRRQGRTTREDDTQNDLP